MDKLWSQCLERLQSELGSEAVHAWLRPLQARSEGERLSLFAPNAFVVERVRSEYLPRIQALAQHFAGTQLVVELDVGSLKKAAPAAKPAARTKAPESSLDPRYTFANFVEGKSNELGKATALQVAQEPGRQYNPLLLYGGTGLGKTHLLHATGNLIASLRPESKVLYLRSEQFVSSMIKALRGNEMDGFKRRFRSVDALLIDDIQFFAGKDRTQEEFFHTFNALFDGKQQIVLTCDRYPKEVEGLQPRLKSRFGWGLSVAIEPPDFETRVAILLSKAQAMQLPLPDDVAMLIAKRMRSNVRDLEGALNTLYARARFSGQVPDVAFARETLRDLLTVHDQQVSLGNIQKVVAEYYQIRMNDMLGKRRTRSLVRPRQIAMALAKELTDHSLPEIGDQFGGRDHTTVLHACRVVQGLRDSDGRLRDDWDKLIRAIVG